MSGVERAARAEHDQRGDEGERAHGRKKFQEQSHDAQIGTAPGIFQLSFGQVRPYFTGTWSMCGQTAANSASSSAPPAFFGVAPRQLSGIANGAEGL